MTYYSNIPTILAQQDFNNRHADMLASARGEVFIGWDLGSEDRTIVWFSDINPVEENVFYRMWRENKVTAKPEWCNDLYDIIPVWPEPKVKLRIRLPDGLIKHV